MDSHKFALPWQELLFGTENAYFLPEVLLRTLIMFIITVISLRLLGKRGVKQLSIYELVVIISLGSAAGDPMFYKDVGLLPALMVFIIIITLFKIVTYLIGKNKKFELLMEGKPIYLVNNGSFSIENFKKEALGVDEFFAELRLQGVSQLGQIEEAILESSGNISIFYYEDKDVKPGLSIMPDAEISGQTIILNEGIYACTFCGYTIKLQPEAKYKCSKCQKSLWIKADNRKRIR